MKLKKSHIIYLAFFLGLVFVVLFWIISINSYFLPFTLKNISRIHYIKPEIWLIDLIPILLITFAILLYDKWDKLRREHNDLFASMQRQTENINNVSTFAEKIGNGEYDYEFSNFDESDTLTRIIQNLRDKLYENNKKESVRNWMMEGKDKISNILRIHNDLNMLSYEVLVTLIKYINVIQGVFYVYSDEINRLKILASYAYNRKKYLNAELKLGEGLVGQASIEQDIIHRTEIPDSYISVTSGILGDKKPSSLLIVPLITEERLQGALEFASFKPFDEVEIEFIKEIGEIIARAIYNLKINEKTEQLLHESQEMTKELKVNEEKLRQNAEEMKATQEELEKTNIALQKKVEEVNQSQKRLYSLLENASELILIYDEYKKLKYVSPSVVRILGYNEEELMHGKFFDRINFRGQQIIDKLFEDLISTPNIPQTAEYSYLHKDGNKIFLESTGRNLIHDTAISGLILNTRDITERKRAEKEQRMRGQMQSLSENSPDIIVRLDPHGQIFYHNPMIETYTGIKYDLFVKKNIAEVGLAQEITDMFTSLTKEIVRKKDKIQKEVPFPSIDGDRTMNVNAIPEFNEEKRLETILFVLHDITERKQIELMIQDRNRKITESINYAHRIQECILPNTKIIQKIFKHSFIFYKPKDVVSGDFPWFYVKGEDVYIAAIDCTGHGVPGAMLSIVGYFLMNQILGHNTIYSPGEILDQLHAGVRSTLRQDQEGANARDGMDVALCKINLNKMEMEYSGAHRPLYHVRNGLLNEYKGTKSAIGGIPKEGTEEQKFKNYVLNIEKGDTIVFFSDGLPDQFGGPEGRKYGPARIKNLVLNNLELPMNQLYKLFREDYDTWLGDTRQIDDVLLIGIKF